MKTLLVLLGVLAFTLPGLADELEARKGHLVIVGGGLQADNEPVYRAVLDRIPEDGTLGVLPTASGVPEESGPGHVQDFQQYAGPNQKIVLLDIRNGDIDKANDPEWVEKIRKCDGLWFTGGDQSRIVATFRPDEGDTPAYDAMWDVLNRGGVIGGTSAGAAMMSDPMIKWGNSHEALLLGVVNDVPDFGVGVGKGMGFLPDMLVDQHFFERGRLGRLLVAMTHASVMRGIGVGENTAHIVDFAKRRTSVIGSNGVLAVGCEDVVHLKDGTLLPAAFYGHFATNGYVMDSEAGEDLSAFGRVPDIAFIEAAMEGKPRSYEGPLAVSIDLKPNDRTRDDVGRYVIHGFHENDSNHEHWLQLRQAAQAALDAERQEIAETQNP
ncbi:MAG: cyanophycinase [Planctomycetota bacterium]